jgi:inner membrane protein involved in colicin E2 resistance
VMKYQKLEKQIKERLELDIKMYLSAGGKIDVRKPGESKPVDATNEWPMGFYNDDNVTFHKKRPRPIK